MKRVGKRGEGKFERISWDEALDTIASSLKKTVEQYGNEAVYIQYSSGIVGGNMTRSSPSASAVKRVSLLQHRANLLCHALHLRQ